jgi:RimJ/RimL family protein N-acetyltransferase
VFATSRPCDRYLGGCGLDQIDAMNRRANLGYGVRTSTRHGVNPAHAVCSIRDWSLSNTELTPVVVATGNIASHRVATKAGATPEGVLKNRLLVHGTAHDATMFSFTR